MNQREVSLSELWQKIKNQAVVVILITLLTGIITAAISIYILEPQYRSNSTLIVGRPESYQNVSQTIDYNDVMLNQKLVGTYGEIMKSQSVMRQVSENLKLNLSLDELSNMVNVQTVNNTEIISLTVTDTIPERAMDIANETAEIFMQEVRSIMKVDNVQILDPAMLPLNPVNPNIFLNTVVGTFLGLVIGILYALFKEFNDTRIKSVEEYKNNFDLPVIGIIPTK